MGWGTINPTITFHFAAPTLINSITMYFDDPVGDDGGVDQPASVGLAFGGGATSMIAIPDKGSNGPDSHVLPSLATTATTVELTFYRNSGRWVFLSEVQFDGRTGDVDNGTVPGTIPEPATFAVWSLLGGIGLVFSLRHSRRG